MRPNVVDRQIIAVEQGRHPLQEFLTTFVPNDTYSGDGKSHVKILTGPNASGKSTYLKQIALIVFMAHIGCFVPAKSATIGIVTHILTQITSVDSIALNTSMFLQDMRQVNGKKKRKEKTFKRRRRHRVVVKALAKGRSRAM